MGDIDQSCQGCSYMENNSCMRYVENRNGRTILCSQGRGNIETQGNDPQSQTHTCNSRACPPKCYLPYPRGYYNENINNELGSYYTDGIFIENKLDDLRNNAEDRESFREVSTIESNRSDMVKKIYDSSDETHEALSAQFKCGPLREGRNYPSLPTLDEMNRLFDSSSYISDTKWDKIKTPLSSEGIFTENTGTLGVSAFQTLGDIFNNTLKHLLDFNGVDIDDLKSKMEEDYSIESERLRDIDNVEFKQIIQMQLRRLGFSDSDNQINQVYNETIGLFKRTLENAKNGSNGSPTCNGEVVSDDVYVNLTSGLESLTIDASLNIRDTLIEFGENFEYHYNIESKCSHATFNNKMIEFILEHVFGNDNKKYLSETIINDWASKKMLDLSITGGQMQQRPMKLIDVFMITEDDSSNFDLETRLNYLMDTGLDPDEEKLIVERIGKYTSIEELGRNPRDVEFIEKKIKKFLGANTQDLVDAFLMSGVSYEDMCNTGFSDRPMKILGNLMNVQTDASNLQEGLFEEKMVIKKLLKYIPSIMRKVLEIAEKVEMERCDRVSKKTQLYKEIYKDLFVESNVMKFELPDMGIFNFFEDFNRNIYTKIILLIILTFMISKIVSLFKVNVSA